MIDSLKPLKRLVYQLSFLLLCYFCSRIIFTLLHRQYFEGITIGQFLWVALVGLRFDISALLVINSVYIFMLLLPVPFGIHRYWHGVAQAVFISFNTVAFLFECSDWAYFPFNNKRATADVLNLVLRKSDFLNLLPRFLIDYWYVAIAAVFFVFLFIRVNRKICQLAPIKAAPKKIIPKIIVLLLVAGLSIIGIRGGIQYIPMGIRNAVQMTDSRYAPIVLNTPFSMINSWQNDQLKEFHYFDEPELSSYINTTKQYTGHEFRKKNVVFIILESFSKEFTGIGGLKSYTPFLDSLMQHALVCTNAFSNGFRSVEGIPAIIAGIPTLQEEPFATSNYGANRITSIVNILARKGYSSTFYHGGNNGTMTFDVFAKNAGFQSYKGRDEYANEADYDGHWGIWDEPYLQYVAKDISQSLSQPFCASVFTLSSHHPYSVPEQYRNVFPKGSLPIHATIGYTDNALRKFFAQAQKEPWFKNTLFVLVADHCSSLSEDKYYNFFQGKYAIPIIYYSPSDSLLQGQTGLLTQQIDILPSVIDYLGLKDSFFAFGNSIFSPVAHRFALQYVNTRIQWTMDSFFLNATRTKPTGIFNLQRDPFFEHNLIKTHDSIAQQCFNYMQAFQQVYSDKMIHNHLWVK